MDGKKVYQIQINGITESANAVDALVKQLDALDKRIKALENSNVKVSAGGRGNASALSEEEAIQREINKLKKEGETLDAKIAASQDEIYKRVDATKQLYKETIADQKAMAAQERLQARNKMQEAGIDPEMLDRAIANSPIVRRAEEIEKANMELQTKQMIEEDIQTILKLDPSVGTADDIYGQENFNDVVKYCNDHPGVRMSEAYKLVNFDRLASVKAQASKQAAINQAKSKGHMTLAAGVTDTDKSVDIPEDQKAQWARWFPNKSEKERRALYNKAIGG